MVLVLRTRKLSCEKNSAVNIKDGGYMGNGSRRLVYIAILHRDNRVIMQNPKLTMKFF